MCCFIPRNCCHGPVPPLPMFYSMPMFNPFCGGVFSIGSSLGYGLGTGVAVGLGCLLNRIF